MKAMHLVTWILLIIGGLNWLLTGLFVGWDLAAYLGDALARLIYVLVGLSAIYEVVTHKANCKMCGSTVSSSMPSSGGMR